MASIFTRVLVQNLSIGFVINDIHNHQYGKAAWHGADAIIGAAAVIFPVFAPVAIIYGIARIWIGDGE